MVMVPATTIAADGSSNCCSRSGCRRSAKLRVPSSVSVWPGGIWTGTLDPHDQRWLPDRHREAMPGSYNSGSVVLVSIRLRSSFHITGEGGRVDLDLVEAHIVAGCQRRDIVVGHEEGQVEGAADRGDDAGGADRDGGAVVAKLVKLYRQGAGDDESPLTSSNWLFNDTKSPSAKLRVPLSVKASPWQQ